MSEPHTVSNPTAALLIIGAEILSAKIADANGPFLLRVLRERGIDVREVRIIADDVDTIADAVRALAPRVDYLLTTGGIGPTHDDVTIAGIAAGLGRRVVRNAEIERTLVERHGRDKLNAARLRLADVPEGATVGLEGGERFPLIQVENITIMPGVPSLMRMCFARLAPSLRVGEFHSRAMVLDVSESRIAAHLTEVQDAMPQVAIGSYPRLDGDHWDVKITIDGRDAAAVEAAYAAIRAGVDDGWVLQEC